MGNEGRQVGLGFLAALLSIVIILGSLVISFSEGGLVLSLVETPTLAASETLRISTPTQPTPSPESSLPALTPGVTKIPTETVLPSPTSSSTPLPTPANCPPPTGWSAILVDVGDTLESLAQAYNILPEQLAAGNCLVTTTLLPGTLLYVPGIPTPTSKVQCGPPIGWVFYTVRPGDTLYHIGLLYGVSVAQLQQANCLGNSTVIHIGQNLYVPNVRPRVFPTATQTATRVPTLTLTPTRTPTTTPLPTSVPVIIIQPSNQTVNDGQIATFSASASGNPMPTVQWQVRTNGGAAWSDISGATSTSLSFTAHSADDGNQYRAVFTNVAGSATTNAATLTVNTPPVVIDQTTDLTVNAGSLATFSASASGDPTPSVQWQVSINGGTIWDDLPGETSTTLSFTALASDNQNQYRAIFTNVAGSITTNAAILTVNVPPAITSQPTDQTVNEGQTATFSASASGYPVPTVQWQESKNGGTIWNDLPGESSTTLSFITKASDNNNQYRAVFTNLAGTATTNAATLVVNTPPVAADQTVSTNVNTIVSITLTGSDKDGDMLTYIVLVGPAHGALSGSAPSLIYLPNPGFSGSDSFTFKANDGMADSNNATVTITVG